MKVRFDVNNLEDCSIHIYGMDTEEFDKLRVILFQLFEYTKSSKEENPFGLQELIQTMWNKENNIESSTN